MEKAFQPYLDANITRLYPNSIALSNSVFSLPMHTELNQDVQEYIAENVLSLL